MRPPPRHTLGVVRLTGEEAEVADRARTREVERAQAAAQAVAVSVETFNVSPTAAPSRASPARSARRGCR